MIRGIASVAALGCSLALSSAANADEHRRGLQIEGMVGGAACISGGAPCHHDTVLLRGRTRPSFGFGAVIGIRPVSWFMIGALYRFGMFNPGYSTDDGVNYTWGGQHTVALLTRVIVPIWRFDFGLTIAPGYSRQEFRRNEGRDGDHSQGFAVLAGPVLDIFVTDHFFVGAEVDFIFNAQTKVCQRRGGNVTCFRGSSQPMLTPTHQLLFGIHAGATFF